MAKGPPTRTEGPTGKRDKGNVAYLDQTLWRQLTESDSDADFCYAWLSLQSRLLGEVISSVVVMGPEDSGPFSPIAFWPGKDSKPQNLSEVLERALAERKGVMKREDTGDTSTEADNVHLAYPVRAAGRLYGASAFEIRGCPQEKLPGLMRQVQWGTAWLEKWAALKVRSRDDGLKERLTWALDLTAVVVQEGRFQASATAFSTQLADRLGCDRVSIGFKKGNNIKVLALSHSAQFKKQMNLIRLIEATMDEAADQQAPVVFPAAAVGEPQVLRAHGELADGEGDEAICTIPFISEDGEVFGAITLERSADLPFDDDTVSLCRSVLALVAPVLEDKRTNDRPLVMKVVESFKGLFTRLGGPGHTVFKLVAVSLLVLVVFLSVVTGEKRVTARANIEGAIQRAVTAPYDGYIYEAPVRAGDEVVGGQVMCRLDDRDMRLERQRILSRRDQYQRQYREAMASGDRTSMKVLVEQINQIEAQLSLVDDQVSRATLRAPFQGLVVSGDLTQSLGSPVQRGQVLFEVAPLDDYRVVLQVDERDINLVKVDQSGELVLNSLPQRHFQITVEKITPVSTPFEGRNLFIVEATLGEASENIRPGMEGYGKLSVGRGKLISIWTGDLTDWLKLWFWSWLP